MSRIGKLPIDLPSGVTASLAGGNVLKVTGPKGRAGPSVQIGT